MSLIQHNKVDLESAIFFDMSALEIGRVRSSPKGRDHFSKFTCFCLLFEDVPNVTRTRVSGNWLYDAYLQGQVGHVLFALLGWQCFSPIKHLM